LFVVESLEVTGNIGLDISTREEEGGGGGRRREVEEEREEEEEERGRGCSFR